MHTHARHSGLPHGLRRLRRPHHPPVTTVVQNTPPSYIFTNTMNQNTMMPDGSESAREYLLEIAELVNSIEDPTIYLDLIPGYGTSGPPCEDSCCNPAARYTDDSDETHTPQESAILQPTGRAIFSAYPIPITYTPYTEDTTTSSRTGHKSRKAPCHTKHFHTRSA